MKAKYDITRLHSDILKWCEKPVFLSWQERWGLLWEDFGWVLKDGQGKHRAFIYHMPDGEEDSNLYFAHLIGLKVESYRLRETYKSAVERYLNGLQDGDPIWDGSVLTMRIDRDAIRGMCDGLLIELFNEKWKDAEPDSIQAYYFLRLDQNPNYQVDGEGA